MSTDVCLVYSVTELPNDGLNQRSPLMDQLTDHLVLEDKSLSNLLLSMKIGIERGHREGPAFCTEGYVRRAVHLVDPQPREVLCSLPGCVRGKTSVSTEKAPEMSDASTHSRLVRKDTSVQMVGCNESLVPFPGENISTWKRCAQVDDAFQDLFKCCTALEKLRKWISGYRTLLLWRTPQRMKHFRPW